MLPTFEELSAFRQAPLPDGAIVANSREGRPVHAYRFADGPGARRISLIAGCHGDEPVGPVLLDRLVRFLSNQPSASSARARFDWWIVPHINPDGAERNRAWSDGVTDAYDFATYLRRVVRELPGDDIEFGFPRHDNDTDARPEPRGVLEWWKSYNEPCALHASLHGMAGAAGPWFLIDPAWANRCDVLKRRCREVTAQLGYRLHDVERHGEKGFTRIERGFCTRPNSESMAEYFRERNDDRTASLFRPSSMESIRALGGDALTLVSEVPLFALPGAGETIEPTDPVADAWHERITTWQDRLTDEAALSNVRSEIANAGVRALPIGDQLRIQWEMIRAGIVQIEALAGQT